MPGAFVRLCSPTRAWPYLPAVSVVFAAGALFATAAVAHHAGLYVAKDNEVTVNFKQIRAALAAGKPDVALRLFDAGAVRKEMRSRAPALPWELEARARTAIAAADVRAADTALMLLFAGLTRDLARDAERQLGDRRVEEDARRAAGRKFLDAIWRYYNLIDFVVGQHDSKASVAIRLAFDEAETSLNGAAPAAAASAAIGPLRRIAQSLDAVIQASSPRRES